MIFIDACHHDMSSVGYFEPYHDDDNKWKYKIPGRTGSVSDVLVAGPFKKKEDALIDAKRRVEILLKERKSQNRYAIITPYYKEEKPFLEKCIESVKNQTKPTDHFLISEGFLQDWIDKAGVRHIKLDQAHSDYGNTPRGIGSLLAVSEGYDGIGFLDADNWLEPNHIETCVEAQDGHDCVTVKKILRLYDEEKIVMAQENNFFDTNVVFFFRSSFEYLPKWALIPKSISGVGDRVFSGMLKISDLSIKELEDYTVNYRIMDKSLYDNIGKPRPPGCK